MKEKEYYIINLKHGDNYFPALCKKEKILQDYIEDFLHTDIGWDLFRSNNYVGPTYKDLLTGKLIYSDEETIFGTKRQGCLICNPYWFEIINEKGKNERIEGINEISQEEMLELLRGLSDEKIDEYRMIMNEIENDAIEMHKQKREEKKQKLENDKEIENFARKL